MEVSSFFDGSTFPGLNSLIDIFLLLKLIFFEYSESNNLDLLYDINLVSLYNIKEAYFNNTELIADKINFDMLTRDISINMNEEKDKIAIFYK